MTAKKKLTPAEENAKVLAQLELKESALKQKIIQGKLAEEDFVQLLNYATKKDLVAQASEQTLQEIADDKKKSSEELAKEGKKCEPGLMDYLILGPSGVAAFELLKLGILVTGAVGIGIPYLVGRYGSGKAEEMLRTFKTSYENDAGAGKFGRALRRAVEYPIFRVPLINKMRRDMYFDGGPVKREGFKYQLKVRRKNNIKNEIARFVGSLKWTIGFCGTVSLLPALGQYGFTAAALPTIGAGVAFGVGASAVYTTGMIVANIISSIEKKKVKGRRLVEQAFDYPPVREDDDEQEENEVSENPEKKESRQTVLEQSLKEQKGDLSKDSELDKNRARMDITLNKKSYQKKKTEQKQKKVIREVAEVSRD